MDKDKKSYLEKRLTELEIQDSDNKITIQREEMFNTVSFFCSDENDNIRINYFSLFNTPELYQKKNKYVEFFRTRLNPVNIINDAKYLSPNGSDSRFFFPKLIIEAFKNKTAINTLIVTEGEFKAFKACLHDIYCVGIAGIHNFKDKETKDLPDDFKLLVKTCKIRNIIFLTDADSMSENQVKKALLNNKDQFTRLYSFYCAIKKFRELCKEFSETDLYFSHIKANFEDKGKGLDDLMVLYKGKENEIKKDIEKLEKSRDYFQTLNITDNSLNKLYQYFLLQLDSKGFPKDFFNRFESVLEENEFNYNKIKYQKIDGRLQIIHHPESSNYIRVGNDYYLKGYTISSKKEKIPELKLWKISLIKQDYYHVRNFINMIPKYISFTNVPDNTENYLNVIEGCYNLYEKIKDNPIEGNCEKTLDFLKGIFQDKIIMALDYLSILYKIPTQNLPVICLVSKEQKTGKTTFLKWLCAIYGNNAIILGNEDFSGNFNSHYASKLIIGIDESFIEKRLIKEKIKRLTTDNRINLEAKGKDIVRMDFIGKFILCSNNEDNFINMDDSDNRFFVVKLNKIEKENPFLLDEINNEIAAFLHFIKTRRIENEFKSRLWFSPEVYRTAALENIIKHSRSKVEKELIYWFNDIFSYIEENEINVTPKLLAKQIESSMRGYPMSLKTEIENILKKNWNLSHIGKNGRFRFPTLEKSFKSNNEYEYEIRWENDNGKYYSVTRKLIDNLD